jgi:hypothetical protein
MTTSFARLLLIFVWFFSTASAFPQELKTRGPCSLIIDRTQCSVMLAINGGCTRCISPAELRDIIENVLARRALAIEAELLDSYEMLSRMLGVLLPLSACSALACLLSKAHPLVSWQVRRTCE